MPQRKRSKESSGGGGKEIRRKQRKQRRGFLRRLRPGCLLNHHRSISTTKTRNRNLFTRRSWRRRELVWCQRKC
uniref:Uncharacterized protein n=1 Tax=Brassica campestris TaxID=3711 RepID=A0A3P6D465_BRACM|nr:unnamed protein product [Brassica rapa]